MIDHISTYATNFEATRKFYEAVLIPLGYDVQADYPEYRSCAFGPEGNPVFWVIGVDDPATPRHIAFSAPDRELVTLFYHKGLENGGESHGAPGLRKEYHEHYYGAFLLDPDGNNVEAVCHMPE